MGEAADLYLYSKLMEDLRACRALPAGVGTDLEVYPTIDRLRAVVRESDVSTLLYTAGGEWSETAALSVSLLRSFAARPDVSRVLRKLWCESTTFACRYEVLFRLLDDPELPLEWHQEILAFTKQHRREFLEASAQWAGGPDRVLPRVAARLGDPSFPRAKAWIYLVVATASPNRDSVVRLISAYAKADDFTGAVARELLG